MRFLWPDLLWLTLILPMLVAAYVYALRRRKREAIAYTNLALVRAAMGPGQKVRRHLPPALFLFALTAAPSPVPPVSEAAPGDALFVRLTAPPD